MTSRDTDPVTPPTAETFWHVPDLEIRLNGNHIIVPDKPLARHPQTHEFVTTAKTKDGADVPMVLKFNPEVGLTAQQLSEMRINDPLNFSLARDLDSLVIGPEYLQDYQKLLDREGLDVDQSKLINFLANGFMSAPVNALAGEATKLALLNLGAANADGKQEVASVVNLIDLKFVPKGGDRYTPVMVMERVSDLQGIRNLSGALQQLQTLPALERRQQVGTWLKGLNRIARALEKSPLIHRDIKPQNIALGTDGQLVLIDTGTSIVRTDTTIIDPGGASIARGTPQYMPLEQMTQDPEQVDHIADSYSLAAVITELLNGSDQSLLSRNYDEYNRPIRRNDIDQLQSNTLREKYGLVTVLKAEAAIKRRLLDTDGPTNDKVQRIISMVYQIVDQALVRDRPQRLTDAPLVTTLLSTLLRPDGSAPKHLNFVGEVLNLLHPDGGDFPARVVTEYLSKNPELLAEYRENLAVSSSENEHEAIATIVKRMQAARPKRLAFTLR